MLCLVAAANAAQLQCAYYYKVIPDPMYECDGKITTTSSDYGIDGVTGDHVSGHGNDEITRIVIRNVSMTAMPKNFGKWFKSYNEFSLSHVGNFPNFQRGDFSDMTQLRGFFARNLPQVGQIPRDTFYDLTHLTHLYLEEMPNMGNFDGDMLINARSLTVFSAKGPNRITQINPGFFRNQGQSLQVVDFRDTKLVRVGFSVFQYLHKMKSASFMNGGCLDRFYGRDVAEALTFDIRTRCQDIGDSQMWRDNNVMKKKIWASDSSSSSSESD